METFAFFAITFEPIGILTHSAYQNDRLNLSFVKDKHTFAKKLPEMVVKLSFMSQFYIETEYSVILFQWGKKISWKLEFAS